MPLHSPSRMDLYAQDVLHMASAVRGRRRCGGIAGDWPFILAYRMEDGR